MKRRPLLLLAASAAAATPVAARAQQAARYPSRPVRIVVPFAAGGVIDVVARILGDPLSALLGQPVVVENLPGAGSTIGARAVARAAPDGHTLLLNGAAQSVIPVLYPEAGFDALADFTPIALVGDQSFLVCVHPSVPANDVASLLAWLRERRDEATFATTGVGAASHLAGELLKRLAGVEFTVVTYRGTPAAVSDLLAGRVNFMIDSQTLLAPLVRDGRLRALAVTTMRRSRLLADLPTLHEAGVAGYSASSWQALYGPAGLPAEVVETVSRAVLRALEDPEVQRRLAEVGVDPMPGDPATAARHLRAETEKWTPILRATGARPG
ncbi:MFS transporter [Caldovatus sediminis]|uniref:MFS transporter n=1 Tax=Caldovatus sediminis TaxID=2041189 RepID=A0A8J3EDR9_9PROT|nr:tripartite tricarboxylate transporter substrate binding protein [Caldovatus sediminis]GGG33196.1 MFS transporter [Caldovatus sediminis]